MINRYRSRADFEQDDLRLILPRWSEENFPKNLEVVDKLKQIAQKYSATPSQVTLAWILVEHPTCQSYPKPTFLIRVFVTLIP
jgi:aryl-alcohol dehydrogenase-like predicted oxidoreductase